MGRERPSDTTADLTHAKGEEEKNLGWKSLTLQCRSKNISASLTGSPQQILAIGKLGIG